MTPFVWTGRPGRVIFGMGTRERVAAEAERAGISRALVLSTPHQQQDAKAIAALLGSRSAGVFDGAVMHTPVEVTENAMTAMRESGADGVVAIGGGSTTGLGKAIAARMDIRQIVLPTTYAGSEMTPILGETRDGVKTTHRDPRFLPDVVIYDVDLTLDLPVALSATSGLNAIAHAAEALYAHDGNPLIALMAQEGIAALARALPLLAPNPRDPDARSDVLYGAWLCGTCLGAVDMALHHKLCHTLGGSFDLPHAETHAILLPHALAFNAPAAPDAMRAIAAALDADDAIEGLNALGARLAIPRSLKATGMPEDGIDRAADLAVKSPYPNPRPIGRSAIRELIRRAWAGEPARAID